MKDVIEFGRYMETFNIKLLARENREFLKQLYLVWKFPPVNQRQIVYDLMVEHGFFTKRTQIHNVGVLIRRQTIQIHTRKGMLVKVYFGDTMAETDIERAWKDALFNEEVGASEAIQA
jgi:hypothetical protein